MSEQRGVLYGMAWQVSTGTEQCFTISLVIFPFSLVSVTV
jgi:hypothetical protein